jgi:hypothetical protein
MLTRSCLTALMLVFSVLGHLAGVPSVARAAIIGSEAIQRLYLDQAEGQVFIYAGGSFDQNVQAGTFTFSFGAPQWQNHSGEGVGGAGSTNRWVFTPTLQNLNVRLGTSFGIPFNPADFALNDPTVNPGNVDRTYSANLSGQAVPEPSTLAMFFGLQTP